MFYDFTKRVLKSILSFIKDVLDFLGVGYKKFVMEHSVSLKKLDELNSKCVFFKLENFSLRKSYDNKIFYRQISPRDYLIYQLVYKRKEIETLVEKADYNELNLNFYKEKIDKIYTPGIFDTQDVPSNKKRLKNIEKRLFHNKIKKVDTDFVISIRLTLRKINGAFIADKQSSFQKSEIKLLLDKMRDRTNYFYNDKVIWDAICRVERGKVSNKMRFAVYKRDGYRCVRCGRKNVDLEVDHIFPIAKGGKSNFSNLQTLCHRCNAIKSDTVEASAVDPRMAKKKPQTQGAKNAPTCPNCNVSMVLRKGKYGDFFGCPNYPDCKHTEQIK